jgi:hypothetical protein
MVIAKKLVFSTAQPGEKVDVIDNECIRTVPIRGIWTEAVIKSKDLDSCVVHYLFWDHSFDEVVPRSQFSNRVRAYGSRTFVERGEIRRHNRIDVLDVHPSRNKWCTGYVVDADERRVLIHYKGYDKKFDEWIGKYSHRLAPYGRRQFPSHVDLQLVRGCVRVCVVRPCMHACVCVCLCVGRCLRLVVETGGANAMVI